MTPNQITDTTYQLHNFINPFDRQDSYILLSGGYSKTLVIDKIVTLADVIWEKKAGNN